MKNLFSCKGRKFTARIHDASVEGMVQVEDGRVYLCQNEKDGADCADKLGYKYSWVLDDGKPDSCGVSDFCLSPSSANEIESYKNWQVGDVVARSGHPDVVARSGHPDMTVIFRSGELVICKNSDGMGSPNYTCDELYQKGYRLKATPEEPEAFEFTMDQIAKACGVPVSQLKIKKD